MDQEICDRCGNLLKDCSDPDVDWYPQMTVDYAEMAREAASAFYEAKHKDAPYHSGTREEWSKTRSRRFPFHFRDGVRIWVSKYDLTPDADWI